MSFSARQKSKLSLSCAARLSCRRRKSPGARARWYIREKERRGELRGKGAAELYSSRSLAEAIKGIAAPRARANKFRGGLSKSRCGGEREREWEFRVFIVFRIDLFNWGVGSSRRSFKDEGVKSFSSLI